MEFGVDGLEQMVWSRCFGVDGLYEQMIWLSKLFGADNLDRTIWSGQFGEDHFKQIILFFFFLKDLYYKVLMRRMRREGSEIQNELVGFLISMDHVH